MNKRKISNWKEPQIKRGYGLWLLLKLVGDWFHKKDSTALYGVIILGLIVYWLGNHLESKVLNIRRANKGVFF